MPCLRIVMIGLLLPALAIEARSDEGKTPRTDLYGDPLPPGAVMRLGTVRLRHYNPDVVFSRDGKQVISCGKDGEVRVWDAATGKLARRTKLARKPDEGFDVERRALSSHGTIAAIWQQNRICLCDAQSGAERGLLPAAASSVRCELAFAPDAESLAIRLNGEQDREEILIWDIKQSKSRVSIRLPSTFPVLAALAFSPDGRRLAGLIVYGDHNLFLWDAATGKELVKAAIKRGSALAWSPDGKTLAVGTSPSGEILMLDANSLRQRQVVKAPANREKPCRTERLAYSPDGRILAAVYVNPDILLRDESIHLWNVQTRQEIQRLSLGYGSNFVFAPDSRTLAFWARYGNAIHLWDVGAKREIHPRGGPDNLPLRLIVSPNGKHLVYQSSDCFAFWDTTGGRLLYKRDTQKCTDFCFFSPDGARLITVDREGCVRIWDAAQGKELRRFMTDHRELSDESVAAGLADGGRQLLIIARLSLRIDDSKPQRHLSVWNLADGKRLSQRPYPVELRDVTPNLDGRKHGIAHAAFSADGAYLTEWRNDRVALVEAASGKFVLALPRGIGEPLVFSPDGRMLAAAIVEPYKKDPWLGNDIKGLAVLETASGEEIFRVKRADVQAFVFAPDDRLVIGVGKERLSAWNTDTGDLFYSRRWPAGVSALQSFAALPGGRMATGHIDGDVLIWDLRSAVAPVRPTTSELSGKKLQSLWSELAGPAPKAYRALAVLMTVPSQTLPLLRDSLQPIKQDGRHVEQLLADLDSDSFEKREAASAELARRSHRIEPILRRALEDKPSLEKGRRLKAILAEPKRPSAEALRMLRAIVILERIGTPEARQLLEKLSRGADVPETQAAKAALTRLQQR